MFIKSEKPIAPLIAAGPSTGRYVVSTGLVLNSGGPYAPIAFSAERIFSLGSFTTYNCKYPPAKPGALVCEPLKAVWTESLRGSLSPLKGDYPTSISVGQHDDLPPPDAEYSCGSLLRRDPRWTQSILVPRNVARHNCAFSPYRFVLYGSRSFL